MAQKANQVLPIKQENGISDVEKARQVLEAERTRISKACAEEINQVVKKHNCKLEVAFSFTPAQGVKYNILITPVSSV